MKLSVVFHSLLISSLLLIGRGASAQHAGHGVSPMPDRTGIAALTTTEPGDDEILALAPDHLQVRFPRPVRLVKLVLRNAEHEWIDISFRYDPRPATHFVWDLPPLADAAYYTADWAALSAENELIRQSFSFAFGPGAEVPSVSREAQTMQLLRQQQESGVRQVSPPPSQIIINRPPPRFDPPFTLDLDDAGPN